jgi:hypothetical protein
MCVCVCVALANHLTAIPTARHHTWRDIRARKGIMLVSATLLHFPYAMASVYLCGMYLCAFLCLYTHTHRVFVLVSMPQGD